MAFDGKLKKKSELPIIISEDNVICETVKPTEDVGKSYILRLYEAEKNKTSVKLTFPSDTVKVYVADMLEENLQELVLDNSSAKIVFKPFEIKTFKVIRK